MVNGQSWKLEIQVPDESGMLIIHHYTQPRHLWKVRRKNEKIITWAEYDL